jgi:deoxyribonuclease-4
MRKVKELLFGTPGIPVSTEPRDTLNGIRQVRALGLDAMELEFVRNINVSPEKAPLVRKAAEDADIILTCHGQYWVNLAAPDKAKMEASIQRMIDAATRIHECGGWSITWHTAFYLGRPKEQVYAIVKKNFQHVLKVLHDKGIRDVWLRPETTGKESQWGDLRECIRLSQELEGVLPCIDFAHMHARHNGTNNTLGEFRQMLTEYEQGLGREGLDNMHIQLSGVHYTKAGEINHLNLKESDMNWKDLLKAWKEFRIKGVVIDESPNIEQDALLLQKTWRAV